MESQNHLGIYLSKDSATVICLSSKGKGDKKVLSCFAVSVEEPEQTLASLIAQRCAEKIPSYRQCEISVALDCAMFMQHNIHTQFTDPKQIAATIRFDAEEALATDITELAVAFKIISTDKTGSALTVFTAKRKILSEILLALQSNNLDPVAIEPDVNSLSRFITRKFSFDDDSHPLFSLLSGRNAYFIVYSKSQQSCSVRTLLIGSAQSRTEVLTRQIPLTTSLLSPGESVNSLKILDSAASVNFQNIAEKLNLPADAINPAQLTGTDSQALAECPDTVGFAIAYGAALVQLEKEQPINFRNDFNPYQGKKLRLQKAAKFLSIAVTILVLALGFYFQAQLLQQNKYHSRLRSKFQKQYASVMFGKKPPTKTSPAKKLSGELRRIKDVKSGQFSVAGRQSVSARLTFLLEAFNKCAKQTNLNINSISITKKVISVAGDTSSRKSTLKLFDSIKKNKLNILQQRLDAKGGRDNFRITIEPKR